MAIKINNQDLQARYINGNSIGKVMLNGGQIRPETIPPAPDPNEYIEYRTNTHRWSGNLFVCIPVAGVGHDGNYGVPYDWNVKITTPYGSIERHYTGVSEQYGVHTVQVPTAGLYRVKITPVSDTYGWALAYGRPEDSTIGNISNKLSSVRYDASYKGYAVSSTNTGDYFRAYQYKWCSNLYTAPAEVLPNTVTTIGNNFRAEQYMGTSIGAVPTEVMPNSVTSIGNFFRDKQYAGTDTILTGADEVLSSNITSTGDYFRYMQYANSTITTAGTEYLPSGLTTIGTGFRTGQYSRCSSLTAAPAESLPDSVTSIGADFRNGQYAYCSSLRTLAGWKDLSIGNTGYRYDQFANCSINIITALSDVGYEMAGRDYTSQTRGWIEHVTQINVPNAYLNNYQNTNLYPRFWVYPKTLFVGY